MHENTEAHERVAGEPALQHMGFGDYKGQDVHRLVIEPAHGQRLRFVWPYLTDQEATLIAERVARYYVASHWSLARVTVPRTYPNERLRYSVVAHS